MLICGDQWGLIKLFRYPCVGGSVPHLFRAHSKQITKIVIDGSRKKLISIGGEDNTIVVWKINSKDFSFSRMISDVFS